MKQWYERGEPQGSPSAEQISDLRQRGPLGPLAEAGRMRSRRPQLSTFSKETCEQIFDLRQRGEPQCSPSVKQGFSLRLHTRDEEGGHPR
jgi:hypothetical protein